MSLSKWIADNKGIVIGGTILGVLGVGVFYLITTKKTVKRPKVPNPQKQGTSRALTDKVVKPPASEEDIKHAIELAGLSSDEEKNLNIARGLLLQVTEHDFDEDQVLKGVKLIQKLTNHKKTLDVIRICGVLDNLLVLLGKRGNNEKLNRRLLLALSNLVTVKQNRRKFDSNSLKDLFYILKTSKSDEIKESTLRTLMNITVEREYEDKVREVSGLPTIIEIVVDKTTTEAVRLQAVRLLVNLIWNTKNKQVMLENGLLEATLKFLHEDPSEQLAMRYIRLLGYFAVNTEPSIYKKVASTECAKTLVKLMVKYKDSEGFLGLAEAVAISVSKITVPHEITVLKALDNFKKAFVQAEDGAAIPFLISLLKAVDKPAYRYNSLCALTNLVRDSDETIAQVKKADEGLAEIRKLCTADDPKTKERATELLKVLSTTESVD